MVQRLFENDACVEQQGRGTGEPKNKAAIFWALGKKEMLTGVDHGDGVGFVASFAMKHGKQAARVDPRRWLMTATCRALPLGGGC
jgi:hypothetical protein